MVRLEELSLAFNAITAHGLKALREPVKLALNDLRDLDLSRNRISVATDEDALAWEDFLSVLKACTVLRRLDLSGNPLGSRAFEILMRVYARQEPVDVPRVPRVVDDDSDDEEYQSDTQEEINAERKHALKNPTEYGTVRRQVLSKKRVFERRQ